MITKMSVDKNEKIEYLFVYGTLRADMRHEMHHILARNASFAGDAIFNGKLFNLSEYPGAVLSDDLRDKVFGEVYALTPEKRQEVFAILDEYEGYLPQREAVTEFRRDLVSVIPEGGGSLMAWIYLYNLDTESAEEIRSGNYLEFVEVKRISPKP
jgi:pyruvate carboxylase